MRVDGRDYRVITLRPGTRARFSTNLFHDTWHILSDVHGAMVLARLLWGLSYQRRPGTFVLIDAAQLDPNPFDAEPADPIALVPSELTTVSPAVLGVVRGGVARLGPSESTVSWQTHGLDLALARRRERDDLPVGVRSFTRRGARWEVEAERVRRMRGTIVLAAPAPSLRSTAVWVARLGLWWYRGQSSVDLDDAHGEVQIWRAYHREVSIARVARAEVLARHAGASDDAPDVLRRLIWQHAALVRSRRPANILPI
ncbi:MAG: hypothetical protein L0Y54_19400 [Sporichthyaceae bacterium]|nr:hypothetical protein [Sporichthyaceae bacterium]